MRSSDRTVEVNDPCGPSPITRLVSVPPWEDTGLRCIIALPYSDAMEGPAFELRVAMATAPSWTSASLPTIAYAEVDGCQANHRQIFFFFLIQEGRKPQIKFRLFGGCVCQGHLASVLMGRQIKAWFRTRVGEAQDSSASELGELFQKLFDVKMLDVA